MSTVVELSTSKRRRIEQNNDAYALRVAQLFLFVSFVSDVSKNVLFRLPLETIEAMALLCKFGFEKLCEQTTPKQLLWTFYPYVTVPATQRDALLVFCQLTRRRTAQLLEVPFLNSRGLMVLVGGKDIIVNARWPLPEGRTRSPDKKNLRKLLYAIGGFSSVATGKLFVRDHGNGGINLIGYAMDPLNGRRYESPTVVLDDERLPHDRFRHAYQLGEHFRLLRNRNGFELQRYVGRGNVNWHKAIREANDHAVEWQTVVFDPKFFRAVGPVTYDDTRSMLYIFTITGVYEVDLSDRDAPTLVRRQFDRQYVDVDRDCVTNGPLLIDLKEDNSGTIVTTIDFRNINAAGQVVVHRYRVRTMRNGRSFTRKMRLQRAGMLIAFAEINGFHYPQFLSRPMPWEAGHERAVYARYK
jgi:hypothetical protein